MNVTQLIAALQRLLYSEPGVEPDTEVATEGCDCWGDVEDVYLTSYGTVLLAREKAEDEKLEEPDPKHVREDVPEHKDPDKFKEVLP